MADKARIVNVILVENGLDRTYFTLEGLEIGKFVEGKKVATTPQAAEAQRPKSAVTKAPSPKEVKRAENIHNDEMMKVENRIPLND